MLALIEGLPSHVVGISVTGRVTQRECREILAPAIARSLRWRAKTRLYYELDSRFPGSGWDDLELGFEQAARCERVAIVSDTAWVRHTVKAIGFLIPAEVRVFATLEAAAARAWITARPGSRGDAAPAPLADRDAGPSRTRRPARIGQAAASRRPPARPSHAPAERRAAIHRLEQDEKWCK